MARPSSFESEFVAQAKKLAAFGHTDMEIAAFFEVSVRTIHRWKLEHKAFARALTVGKRVADKRVEAALYQRAVGFSHEEDRIELYYGKAVVTPTIKNYPPDTTACIFWLKNRDPKRWRDKQEHEHQGGITVHMDAVDSAL